MYTVSERKASDATRLARCCEEDDGWNPTNVDKSGNGTFYRQEPGLATHSFKVRGVVKEPMLALACVLLELDLYTEWYPMANMSEELTSSMSFHKQSRFAVTVPWPIANREVCLDGYGVDLIDERRVIVVAKGLEDGQVLDDGRPVPEVKKGNVRCGMEQSGFVLEALSPTETRVTFMMNVDPRIPNVPMWLINLVSRQMMGMLLKEMAKAAKKGQEPTSKYAQRRNDPSRKEVYQYLEKRAKEMFANQES